MRQFFIIILSLFLGFSEAGAASISSNSPLTYVPGLVAGMNVGVTATGTAGSTIVVSWQQLAVSDGSTGLLIGPGTFTANPATAGPAVNGRDQAGAFANNTWIYVYEISSSDGTSNGGLLSQSSSAPTLPSGYTRKSSPLTAFYTGAGTGISITFYWSGNFAYYNAGQNSVSGGSATSLTLLGNLSALVPPQANRIDLQAFITGTVVNAVLVYSVDGVTSVGSQQVTQVSAIGNRIGPSVFPCIGQTFYYSITSATDSTNINVDGWGWSFSP